jgi:predicted DNA-binding transcriptional regulator AlpA
MERQLTEVKYASAATLARRYSVHVSTIWRLSAGGVLPSPVKIGTNSTRWDIAACDAAIASRQGTAA